MPLLDYFLWREPDCHTYFERADSGSAADGLANAVDVDSEPYVFLVD